MPRGSGTQQINRNLEAAVQRMMRGGEAAVALTMSQAEETAQRNRSWTDRTGDARRSIRGSKERRGNRIVGALAIGVYYGIFLELANAGRFGVVNDTVNGSRARLLRNLKELIEL